MYRIRISFLFFIAFITPSLLHTKHPFFTPKPEGIIYPTGFLKGVASSTYQNGGHNYWQSLGYRPVSNWTWFENEFKARFIIDREREGGPALFSKSSPINRGEKVGISAHVWKYMFDDIQLIKQLGCNAHRFEIPWTDLNPELYVWNEEAFDFFDRYIDALLENDIEPIITIYHWVHPLWFHELGAWEHEENIPHFVEYAQKLFERFGHKVSYWCTINEPTVVSVCGYILGTHAPGKKDHASMLRPFCADRILSLVPYNYALAGTVLTNLFKAHMAAYDTLKALPHGSTASIGIIHQAAYFEPLIQSGLASCLNPISCMLAHQFNKNFAHTTFMNFFKTGHFVYTLPGGSSIEWYDAHAPQSLDFIGLNFYADMFFAPAPTCHADDVMTDMTMWAIRPQSLYRAIKEMATLQVPIIITENGICDAMDDRRTTWIMSYSNAVKQAIDDGYDVRGYCYWSLLDNYEWNMGHNKKFGLYAVDTLTNDPTQKTRTLRKGSEMYRDYVTVAPCL